MINKTNTNVSCTWKKYEIKYETSVRVLYEYSVMLAVSQITGNTNVSYILQKTFALSTKPILTKGR